MSKRHPDTAPGDWFIDTACMDCAAARNVAPDLIVRRGGQSVFARQPETEDEIRAAWRARLLCPTASVRSESPLKARKDVFPERLAESVYRLGYNAKESYGAHSYVIRRTGGNAMVDSPRFTRAVVEALEAWGGLSDVLLSHRDDVADAERYAKHFGARVWIHEWDRSAAPFATGLVRGREAHEVAPGLLAIPVPGHTKGSVVYLSNGRWLFTGDSLAWSDEEDDLVAWEDFCWYSWPEQTKSLENLLAYSFEGVFAGHGASKCLPAAEMRTRLAALVARMKSGPAR